MRINNQEYLQYYQTAYAAIDNYIEIIGTFEVHL